jgi:hypothetical protein
MPSPELFVIPKVKHVTQITIYHSRVLSKPSVDLQLNEFRLIYRAINDKIYTIKI